MWLIKETNKSINKQTLDSFNAAYIDHILLVSQLKLLKQGFLTQVLKLSEVLCLPRLYKEEDHHHNHNVEGDSELHSRGTFFIRADSINKESDTVNELRHIPAQRERHVWNHLAQIWQYEEAFRSEHVIFPQDVFFFNCSLSWSITGKDQSNGPSWSSTTRKWVWMSRNSILLEIYLSEETQRHQKLEHAYLRYVLNEYLSFFASLFGSVLLSKTEQKPEMRTSGDVTNDPQDGA
jgi:hypothetical protein